MLGRLGSDEIFRESGEGGNAIVSTGFDYWKAVLSEDIVIGEKTICLMIWKIPLNLKKGKRKAFINPFTEDFDPPKRKC
jgi:hypothetical protein